MVIAALISSENIPGSPLWHSLLLLSQKYPADRFIIFSKQQSPVSAGNIIFVSNVPRRNALLRQFWYRNTLPGLLKKYNAEAFISDTGISGTKMLIPQFLFLSDLFFEEKQNAALKKSFSVSLQKAKMIFTAEDLITNVLIDKYNVEPAKLRTAYHGVFEAHEQNLTAEQTKERFTAGQDYFISPADPSSAPHLMSLLKAFSLFKKRQRSSMKLVLVLNKIAEEGLIPDFSNYKYREDVVIVPEGIENASSLILHAYAIIWLGRYSPDNEVFRAIHHHIPVIAADTDINHKLFGDAALFSEVSPGSLTEQMQLLYKDETAKNNIAALGDRFVQKYDAAKAAEALYLGLTAS